VHPRNAAVILRTSQLNRQQFLSRRQDSSRAVLAGPLQCEVVANLVFRIPRLQLRRMPRESSSIKLLGERCRLIDADIDQVPEQSAFWSCKPAAIALNEFQASLKSAPNRFHALYCAAQAAESANQHGLAKVYYSKVVEICSLCRPDDPILRRAQQFLAMN
jgi:hypothetical protein